MRYHTHLLHLGGEQNTWQLEERGGDGSEALSFEDEIRELEANLKDVEQWQARVDEIKRELQPQALQAGA